MYANTCAACHGEDGKALNFGDADEPEYIGTLALDNPWEFVHKAAFGQPGEPMPSAIGLGWSLEQLAGLIAYAQSLPAR
jgi:thiosulfate dehydrogenase